MHLATLGITELREPQRVARAVIDDGGIDELAASIKRVGLLQPLLVKAVDGGYEVLAGHRRLLACKRLGLPAVKCLVRSEKDGISEAVKLHENLYRQELNPVEEGAFFTELLPECGNDTNNLAALLGQSREYVESRLLLLQGDPEVCAAVAKHEITLGAARELNRIASEKDRKYYLEWCIKTTPPVAVVRQWRVNAEAAAAAAAQQPAAPTAPPPPLAPARDVFECVFCGESEPKTDLEFWHAHRFCRGRVQKALQILGLDPMGGLAQQLELLASEVRKAEVERGT